MKKLLFICLVLLSTVAVAQNRNIVYLPLAEMDEGFPFENPPVDTGIVGEGHLFTQHNPIRYNVAKKSWMLETNGENGVPPTITMFIKNSQAQSKKDEFKRVEVELPTDIHVDWKSVFANPNDGDYVTENGIPSFQYKRKMVRLSVVQVGKRFILNVEPTIGSK